MNIMKYLLIYYLIAISVAAYNYDTTLKIEGNGDMYSRSDAGRVSDLAEGSGTQEYHLSLFSQSEILDMHSEYELNSTNGRNILHYIKIKTNGSADDWDKYYNPINWHNKYSIITVTPNGLLHRLSVQGTYNDDQNNLSAKSHISLMPVQTQKSPTLPIEYELNAKYTIIGNGSITQSLSDLNTINRPKDIAVTWAKGKFSLSSSLSEDSSLAVDEVQTQSEKGEGTASTSIAQAETNVSSLLKELDDLLKDGTITGTDYSIKLNRMYLENKIPYNVYASKINEMTDKGYLAKNVKQEELMANASAHSLNDLRAMLIERSISLKDFLDKIKDMLDQGRINEVKYLAELKSLPNVNMSNESYNLIKDEILKQLSDKLESNRMDRIDYISILIEMKDLDLITQSDLENMQEISAQSALDQMNESLLNDDIDEVDYFTKMNEMALEHRLSEDRAEKIKTVLLEKLKEKLNSKIIDLSKFESILNRMLELKLIAADVYANLLHDVIKNQDEPNSENLTDHNLNG